MSRYIPESIKKLVAKRASYRCEYCLVFERHSFLSFHIEHIVSLKHGGNSDLDNLAYSCPVCNVKKGSDIATFLDSKRDPIRFFNPRTDKWNEHFSIENSGLISPISDIGKATVKIFEINSPDSLIERKALIEKKLF